MWLQLAGSIFKLANHRAWVRILRTDAIRTRLISVLTAAKMQRLEVVRGHSEFLSHFSIPQANPTQTVKLFINLLRPVVHLQSKRRSLIQRRSRMYRLIATNHAHSARFGISLISTLHLDLARESRISARAQDSRVQFPVEIQDPPGGQVLVYLYLYSCMKVVL